MSSVLTTNVSHAWGLSWGESLNEQTKFSTLVFECKVDLNARFILPVLQQCLVVCRKIVIVCFIFL